MFWIVRLSRNDEASASFLFHRVGNLDLASKATGRDLSVIRCLTRYYFRRKCAEFPPNFLIFVLVSGVCETVESSIHFTDSILVNKYR